MTHDAGRRLIAGGRKRGGWAGVSPMPNAKPAPHVISRDPQRSLTPRRLGGEPALLTRSSSSVSPASPRSRTAGCWSNPEVSRVPVARVLRGRPAAPGPAWVAPRRAARPVVLRAPVSPAGLAARRPGAGAAPSAPPEPASRARLGSRARRAWPARAAAVAAAVAAAAPRGPRLPVDRRPRCRGVNFPFPQNRQQSRCIYPTNYPTPT